MALAPIADGLFEVVEGVAHLIGGRRKSDGRLWSFTVQRFRPKSPPYAGADDEKSFRPYALGYVELPGEVIVESRIETDDFAALKIGAPMRLKLVPFPKVGGDVLAYAFEPAA
jgi:uncharacterized OB-fold protein